MYLVLTHLSNSETRILKELGYIQQGWRYFSVFLLQSKGTQKTRLKPVNKIDLMRGIVTGN